MDRYQIAEAVKQLAVHPGDVVLIRVSETARVSHVGMLMSQIAGMLRTLNMPRVAVLAVPADVDVATISEKEMKELGWVRAPEGK